MSSRQATSVPPCSPPLVVESWPSAHCLRACRVFLQKKKLKRQRDEEEDELEIPPRYQGQPSFLPRETSPLQQAGSHTERQNHEAALC